MDCIDLRKYLAAKESRTGRKRYNSEILLKVILFAFMEYGYASLAYKPREHLVQLSGTKPTKEYAEEGLKVWF